MSQAPKIYFFLKMNRVIAGYKFNKETTQVATTANALTNAIGDLKTEDIQIHDFFSYSCANICNNSSEKHISFIQENLNLSNHSNLSRINVLKTNGELNPREPLGPFTKPSLPFLTCLEKKQVLNSLQIPIRILIRKRNNVSSTFKPFRCC